MTQKQKRHPLAPPPKFDDCTTCLHIDSKRCRRCDNGELFEIRIDDSAPTERELMRIYKDMHGDE